MLYQYRESKPFWTSFENPTGERGGGGRENGGAKGCPFANLNDGEEKTLLDVTGEGLIRRIWFTIDKRDPHTLKNVILRAYWDGDAHPAIDVPIADFFCMGNGRMTPFENVFFSSPEGRSFNCIVPMPFKKGARITLTNRSGNDIPRLFYDVDGALETLPENSMYFHAIHTVSGVEDRALGEDVPILPAVKGRGCFVGMNVSAVVNPVYGKSWWGEGEVKVYLGDDELPTLNGTGTEDFIGTAWGQGEYTNLHQGCTWLREDEAAFYRFHDCDPICFSGGLRVMLQNMGGCPVPEARKLFEAGAPMIPTAVDLEGKLTFLYQKDFSWDDLPQESFMIFYRRDAFSVAAYLYADRAGSLL